VRCTLRPPEPPRGHGIGGPSASAPLCVSDRLGGMPLCGRLRDGPLRPPLPPPSPAGMTRRSPGAARPTSTSFFAGRRARDGAAATAAAYNMPYMRHAYNMPYHISYLLFIFFEFSYRRMGSPYVRLSDRVFAVWGRTVRFARKFSSFSSEFSYVLYACVRPTERRVDILTF
jgi:hypothetical protein